MTFALVSSPVIAFVPRTESGASGPPYLHWAQDELNHDCGPNSPTGTWNSCTVGVTYGSLYYTGWQATALTAARRWNAYDGQYLRLDFSYDASSGTTNVSLEQRDLGQFNPAGKNDLGETYSSYYIATGAFLNTGAGSSIYINSDQTIPFCTVNDSGCPDSNHFSLEHVMTHELGHALGMDHPYPGPLQPSVMECDLQTGETEFNKIDDQNGEYYLYSGHPADFGSPGAPPKCTAGS